MNIRKERTKKTKRYIYAVGAPIILALLFNACTWLLKPGEEDVPVPVVDENMFDCFCANPNQDQNDFICIESPGTDNSDSLATGNGKGLLDGLRPTDDWDLIGNNTEDTEEEDDQVRKLFLTITGDEPSYPVYTAEYDPVTGTLTLSERDGDWNSTPLAPCED